MLLINKYKLNFDFKKIPVKLVVLSHTSYFMVIGYRLVLTLTQDPL